MQEELIDRQLPDAAGHSGYRHDTTGQVVIMANGDTDAYHKFCDGIHASLAPEGELENAVAQAVADDRWRLQRAAAIENSTFAMGFDEDREPNPHPEMNVALQQAVTWMRQAKNLSSLCLYETRTLRRINDNMTELKDLQAQRKAALEQAVEEAALLAHLAAVEGEAFDLEQALKTAPPSRFTFSAAFIGPLVDRKNRLARALKVSKRPLSRAA
jgi:hypothetical protein